MDDDGTHRRLDHKGLTGEHKNGWNPVNHICLVGNVGRGNENEMVVTQKSGYAKCKDCGCCRQTELTSNARLKYK